MVPAWANQWAAEPLTTVGELLRRTAPAGVATVLMDTPSTNELMARYPPHFFCNPVSVALQIRLRDQPHERDRKSANRLYEVALHSAVRQDPCNEAGVFDVLGMFPKLWRGPKLDELRALAEEPELWPFTAAEWARFGADVFRLEMLSLVPTDRVEFSWARLAVYPRPWAEVIARKLIRKCRVDSTQTTEGRKDVVTLRTGGELPRRIRDLRGLPDAPAKLAAEACPARDMEASLRWSSFFLGYHLHLSKSAILDEWERLGVRPSEAFAEESAWNRSVADLPKPLRRPVGQPPKICKL